jgi:sugar (pentulose or hexulose) kinase
LLQNHSRTVARGTLQHQADFINRRLIGHAVPTDSSNALKAGYDLIKERWPSTVLQSLGIPQEMLPVVVRSGSQLGEVCKAASQAMGVPAGTPVIAGMTDGCAAQIGAGALSPGCWNSVLGTTLVLKGVATTLPNDPNGVVYSHRSPDGNWLPGGASSIGAGILATEFPGRNLDLLSTEATKQDVTDVIAYPLAGRGERFPFQAPDANRFTIGQPRDDTEQFAAILQGIAFIERLCFDYLDFIGLDLSGRLTFTGGATRNRHWCQLRADVLNRPVTLVENTESAFGMAVLAAAHGRPLIEVAEEMVKIKEIIEPRLDRYCRPCESYVRLLDELTKRGWLSVAVKDHAIKRATA